MPLNVCLEKSAICNGIASCADDSDESKCSSSSLSSLSPTVLTTPQNSLLNTTITTFNSTINGTNTIINNDTKPRSISKMNFLIVLLIIVIIITIIVGSIWLYGRRKRRFREFLAQLDNNTDWEYEQLDDGPPSLTASRHTMTPIFSMLNHSENLNRRNVNQNNAVNASSININNTNNTHNNDYDVNLMHTLTDVNRNSLSNSNNNNNANNNLNINNRNINERTPITVIT